MPNLKGGKKYKAGKHADTKPEFHEILEGQMVARVLKHLGDRNVLVYCNDTKERIAHIRGGLSKKKAFIETGDLVLISNRGIEIDSKTEKMDRADILAKYDHACWNQLKKIEGMKLHLFLQVENMDRDKIKNTMQEDMMGGFEFEPQEDEESEESEEDVEERNNKKLVNELKRKSEQNAKNAKQRESVEDDINIDDI